MPANEPFHVEDPYRFCTVPGCNQPADRHHIKPRSVLSKKLWKDPKYIVNLCRRHHREVEQVGPIVFCKKYDYPALLERYKELKRRIQ